MLFRSRESSSSKAEEYVRAIGLLGECVGSSGESGDSEFEDGDVLSSEKAKLEEADETALRS